MRSGTNEMARFFLKICITLAATALSVLGVVYFAQRGNSWGALFSMACVIGFIASTWWFHRIRMRRPLADDPHMTPPIWMMRLFFAFLFLVLAVGLFFWGKHALESGSHATGYKFIPIGVRRGYWVTAEHTGWEARQIGAGLCLWSAVLAFWGLALLWPGLYQAGKRGLFMARTSLGVSLLAILLAWPPWRIATEFSVAAFYAIPILSAVVWYAVAFRRGPEFLIPTFVTVMACVTGAILFGAYRGIGSLVNDLIIGTPQWWAVALHIPFVYRNRFESWISGAN